jgi:hypothetical protein
MDKKKTLSFDDKRVEKLAERGHYPSLLEEYEMLRLKFLHEDLDKITKEEAIKLTTLTKYMMKYGHSEPYKLNCKYFYEKYIKPFNL